MKINSELLAQAERGDGGAMLQLGNKAIEAEDFASAINWFGKAFDAGVTYGVRTVVQLYALQGDTSEFMKWLLKLANRGDSWGKVILGVVYCGGLHHMMAAFDEDAFPDYKDLDKGIALIEEGVVLAEDDEHGLDFFDYNAIAASYGWRATQWIEQEKTYRTDNDYYEAIDDLRRAIDDLNKEVLYLDKWLEVVPPPFTDEQKADVEAVKNMKRSSKDKAEALTKIFNSRPETY